MNLLSVLSENGRLSSAPRVFTDFNALMAAYRGELEVIVTSAEALDSKSMSRLEKALKGTQLAEGKQLKINNKVGPFVTGFTVQFLGVMLMSRRSTLTSLVVFWWTLETRQVSIEISLWFRVGRVLTLQSTCLLHPRSTDSTPPLLVSHIPLGTVWTKLIKCRGCLDIQIAMEMNLFVHTGMRVAGPVSSPLDSLDRSMTSLRQVLNTSAAQNILLARVSRV